ncbi:UNVERIFIED_CONTAM: hypothetical protein FKN15_074772 [Acipenser sinensis]
MHPEQELVGHMMETGRPEAGLVVYIDHHCCVVHTDKHMSPLNLLQKFLQGQAVAVQCGLKKHAVKPGLQTTYVQETQGRVPRSCCHEVQKFPESPYCEHSVELNSSKQVAILWTLLSERVQSMDLESKHTRRLEAV